MPRPLMRSAMILAVLTLPSSQAAAQASACPTSVADSTTATIEKPKLVTAPAPRYPMALWRSKVTGAVRLQFIMGCDGRVDASTVVVRESTDTLFTRSAVTAILGSRFSPAMLNGRAVPYRKEQVIRFELRKAP